MPFVVAMATTNKSDVHRFVLSHSLTRVLEFDRRQYIICSPTNNYLHLYMLDTRQERGRGLYRKYTDYCRMKVRPHNLLL